MSEAIEAMQKLNRRSGPACWHATLNDAELTSSTNEAMARTDISSSVISLWLKSKGVQASGYSVARHRRNDCTCSHD